MVHTFWPLMTHSSPSSTALVFSDARSEPLLGSLKPWHQRIVPLRICGRNSFFCSSVPHCRMVGPTSVSPKKSARIGAFARANSSDSTTPCMVVSPLPPYSVGQVAQIQPPSNSLAGQPALNALRSSGLISNPSSNQPSGRLASSQARISRRKASSSGAYFSSMGQVLTRGSSPVKPGGARAPQPVHKPFTQRQQPRNTRGLRCRSWPAPLLLRAVMTTPSFIRVGRSELCWPCSWSTTDA